MIFFETGKCLINQKVEFIGKIATSGKRFKFKLGTTKIIWCYADDDLFTEPLYR